MKTVGILKDSLMVESLLKILMKRGSQGFYKLIDVHSVTNVLGKSISSINVWNIVNLQGKYDFFLCVGSKYLEKEETFPGQMNRYPFDLIKMPQLCCK